MSRSLLTVVPLVLACFLPPWTWKEGACGIFQPQQGLKGEGNVGQGQLDLAPAGSEVSLG